MTDRGRQIPKKPPSEASSLYSSSPTLSSFSSSAKMSSFPSLTHSGSKSLSSLKQSSSQKSQSPQNSGGGDNDRYDAERYHNDLADAYASIVFFAAHSETSVNRIFMSVV